MLDPLATTDDLTARGITVPSGMDAATLLNAASEEIRSAAGCPISQITSTVTLVVDDYCGFDLPAGPVTAVSAVVVDTVPLDGWVVNDNTITMPSGWTLCLPAKVTVTFTHGLPTVPADIIDLACGMVSIAANQGSGYGSNTASSSVRLGEYAESATRAPGTVSPSPMALPDTVRARLRARFGNNVAAIATS